VTPTQHPPPPKSVAGKEFKRNGEQKRRKSVAPKGGHPQGGKRFAQKEPPQKFKKGLGFSRGEKNPKMGGPPEGILENPPKIIQGGTGRLP